MTLSVERTRRRRPLRFTMRLLGWAIAAVVMLALVGLVTGFIGWQFLANRQPAAEGRARLDGLSANVGIVRDVHGVPHIFAQTMDDAYAALGYVHAQDRLFQMEMMRRVGAGRLSELVGHLGDFGLRIDRLMRTLGLYRHAEASLDALEPETRRALDAYARGVNAWLETRDVPLPLEFQLLWHEPEPWRPADSIVWGKLMALQLSDNWRSELQRMRLSTVLRPEQLEQLFPQPDPASPITLADGARPDHQAPQRRGDGSVPGAGETVDWNALAAAIGPPIGPQSASNQWVLAANRTATGAPILANDPHLGLDAPILWYLARIVTPELELVGATVPGVPLHILGHNGQIAWGVTTTGGDVQDLVIERIDPADPGRYLSPSGSEPFTIRDEVILRRGQEPLTLRVRETRNGPVLSDLDDQLAPAETSGEAVSLRFTALSGEDTTADALFRLNRARSWDEFKAALRRFVSPQQNFVYADRGGTIGFIAPARIPIRGAGNGRWPVPGWDQRYDWTGTVPFDALPQSVNPASGRFVNANNRIVGDSYPFLIAQDWQEDHRARRIEQRLANARGHKVADSEALLMDVISLAAIDLLPLMLDHIQVDRTDVALAVQLLQGWTGTMSRNEPQPLIFEWWLLELNRAIMADELGQSFNEMRGLNATLIKSILTTHQAWCDDVTTEGHETCRQIVRRSFDRTLNILSQRHGPHVAGWRWGSEHRAPLAHQILGRIPGVGHLVDIGVETDGGFYTVNRGATRTSDPENPFTHVHGAGFRAVYDLAALDRSRVIIATGQSGNPLSPHWGDLVQSWRDGRMLTLAGSQDELLVRGGRRLDLHP